MFGFEAAADKVLLAVPLLAPLLGVLAFACTLFGWRAAARFWRVDPGTGRCMRAAAVEAGMTVLMVTFLLFALALPQWGYLPGPVVQRGRDVVLVVDVSRSMLAEDVPPSRLERAKADLTDFVAEAARQGGARIGLVAFAGVGRSLAPLTQSYDFVRGQIERLDPGIVHRGGSYLETGVREALTLFDEKTHNYRDIVAVTDGDDFGSEWDSLRDKLKDEGVALHVLVLGDPEQPAEIPIYDRRGGRRLLRYRGQVVYTRAHAEPLRTLARETGGLFVPAFTGPVDCADLYRKIVLSRRQRQWAERLRARPIHRFQWFLVPALALLAWQTWRWYRRSVQATVTGVPNSVLLVAGLIVCTLLMGAGPEKQKQPDPAGGARYRALELMRQALQFERRGQLPQAAASLEEAIRAAPDWWLPVYELAAVRAGLAEWPAAARGFLDARRLAPVDLHPLINYGIGTAFLEQAEELLAQDERGRARTALQHAEQFLDDALQMLPDAGAQLDQWLHRLTRSEPRERDQLADAIRKNLELARRLLARLRQAAEPDQTEQGESEQSSQRQQDGSPRQDQQEQPDRQQDSQGPSGEQDQSPQPPPEPQRDERSQQPQATPSTRELDRDEAMERLRAELQRLREREQSRFSHRSRSYVPRAERDW